MKPDDFVGTRIRKLREGEGLSAMALQRLTGLSQATLYRAEKGGIVSPRTAAKLAEALRCDAADLVNAGGAR